MWNYQKGDATAPVGDDVKVICHCCNDEGGWGAGFVLALSKRWKTPEMEYRKWYKNDVATSIHGSNNAYMEYGMAPLNYHVPFKLGNVIFVQVGIKTWVANIIGQQGTKVDKSPVRYFALEKGLSKVREFCEHMGASVHMPRMGAGLAGGSWHIITAVIEETLIFHDISVTVYDFD